jgi:hypothetical protein
VHAFTQIAIALQREVHLHPTRRFSAEGTLESGVRNSGGDAQFQVLGTQPKGLVQCVVEHALGQSGGAFSPQSGYQPRFDLPGDRRLGEDDQGGTHR